MASFLLGIGGFLLISSAYLVSWVLVSCQTCTEVLAGILFVLVLGGVAMSVGIMAIVTGRAARRRLGQTNRDMKLARVGIILGSVSLIGFIFGLLYIVGAVILGIYLG